MDTRKDFHQRIEELLGELLKMSDLCLDTIDRTRDSFIELDPAKALRVIEDDDRVDALREYIEESGVELIARQAPVAVDLRTIIVIMRLAQHLERVGDLCVNIAKIAMGLKGRALTPWIEENINEMFKRSRNILARAIEAFKRRDVEAADSLNLLDDQVDLIYIDFFTHFDKEREDGMDVIIRVVMVARFLERIADHAVDIGEHVRFLVHGYREDKPD